LKKTPLSIHDRVIKILLDKGAITRDDLEKASEEQKVKGGKLIDLIVESGMVSKKDLTAVLCFEIGCPAIDLTRYKISPEVIKLIPKKTIKQYKIIPVSKMGNVLTVAMADPLDVFALDDLKSITKCEIGPVIANEADIVNAISEYYEGISHESIEQMVEGIQEESEIRVLEGSQEADITQAELLRLTQDAPVVKITNMVIADAVKLGASDILIEPLENYLRIRYRVDGMLLEGKNPSRRIHNALISRLKVMSDLNISERRLPQDGRFKLKMFNREVDFRISILPSNMGEKAALRVLDKSQAKLNIDSLGFEKKPLEDIKKISQRPHGMILVCGPTGCGKTTTLYSVLKHVDSPEKNIITVEDPVEFQLFGINQVNVRADIGLTFASVLRSILRQDPDIIMVGEIRDFLTVDIAIKAALTGHLVLSTLHTTTATGSIIRLVNMGVEPFLITSSVLMVAAQRLIRRICPKCKEEIKLDSRSAKQFGINSKTTVYKGAGCKACQQTGYKGRVGLMETLILSPKIKDLIMDRAQEHVITEAAKKEGMRTLRQNAIKKMIDGFTSPEEVLRLTVGDQEIPAEDK